MLLSASILCVIGKVQIYTYIYIYLSDFVKTWPLGSRLAPGAAQLQASPVSEKVGGLPPWSVQLDSPGTALNSAWVDQALGSKLVG